MKIKTIAYIHYTKYSWEEEGEFRVDCIRLNDNEYHTFVGEQEVEIDVPDNYDPRPQKIAALEKQKQKAMADYQKSVMDINHRISKLLALELTV